MRPIHPQVLTIPLNTPRPQKRGQIKASHRGQVELTQPRQQNLAYEGLGTDASWCSGLV
jgi:hypothetical protein